MMEIFGTRRASWVSTNYRNVYATSLSRYTASYYLSIDRFESPYEYSLILKSGKFGFLCYSHIYQFYEQIVKPIRILSNGDNNQPLVMGILRLCKIIHENFMAHSSYPNLMFLSPFSFPTRMYFNACQVVDGVLNLLHSLLQIRFPAFFTRSWHERVTFMDCLN